MEVITICYWNKSNVNLCMSMWLTGKYWLRYPPKKQIKKQKERKNMIHENATDKHKYYFIPMLYIHVCYTPINSLMLYIDKIFDNGSKLTDFWHFFVSYLRIM